LGVKVTAGPAPVEVRRSSQEITADAGLVLVRELAARLGIGGLLDRLTVKRRRRGFSPAQAVMAIVETLAAGGECLDDSRLLGTDRAQERLRGHALPDPTTLGRFLRRFNIGHIAQLNLALDALFERVHPLVERGEQITLDIDASYVETHGPERSRQGARGTYAGKVCWHPLFCFIAETGEWLGAKLRNGHAAAQTGAVGFLDTCLRRLPEGVRVFLRADEGFWGQPVLSALEQREVTYAVGAPLIASVKQRITEVPESAWGPSCYRQGSEVAEFRWRPKTWKRERRFVVRRDPVETGEQLQLDGREFHHWVIVTNDRERTADELERWQRAKANVENRIKEAKLGLGLDNLPSQIFNANWTYLLLALIAYNLLVWLKLLALPASERANYAKRLRFRFIAVAGSVGRSGRRLVLRLQASYALFQEFVEALTRIRSLGTS
jgi:Transposase DDE domain group 1